MAKYVYPGTNKPEWHIHFRDFELSGIKMCLKSAYPEGRIISDDNHLG